MNRIRDWSELDPDTQRRRREGARAHAAALNPVLNAFVELIPSTSTMAAGSLNGLPYAAKDMFRMPAREPGCGFGGGVAFAIEGVCDAIARPSAAGADLI